MICYATLESGFDSEDDYVALDNQFKQLEAMNFDPKRIVAGAPQLFNVTGGFLGDTIIWTAKQTQPYCEVDASIGYDPDGPATSTKSAPYVLDNNSPVLQNDFQRQ